MTTSRIREILGEAKKLAQEYSVLTGKPLGITGEVAEYEAARILNLELASARQQGFDATEKFNGTVRTLQIKGRRLGSKSAAGRMSKIDIRKEWDAVLLVLLDVNFDAVEIYEAERNEVIEKLTRPGSQSRNVRGQLGVSQFKSIARLRWQRE